MRFFVVFSILFAALLIVSYWIAAPNMDSPLEFRGESYVRSSYVPWRQVDFLSNSTNVRVPTDVRDLTKMLSFIRIESCSKFGMTPGEVVSMGEIEPAGTISLGSGYGKSYQKTLVGYYYYHRFVVQKCVSDGAGNTVIISHVETHHGSASSGAIGPWGEIDETGIKESPDAKTILEDFKQFFTERTLNQTLAFQHIYQQSLLLNSRFRAWMPWLHNANY